MVIIRVGFYPIKDSGPVFIELGAIKTLMVNFRTIVVKAIDYFLIDLMVTITIIIVVIISFNHFIVIIGVNFILIITKVDYH